MLPLCVVLALLGVLYTAISLRRGRRGRVVQGVGLTLAPVGLYLSGLLRLLWDGVGAVLNWVGSTAFSSVIWIGLGLLGLALVLWVVGGVVARRSPRKATKAAAATPPAVSGGRRPTAAQGAVPAQQAKKPAQPVDDDMAEIEALLKSRGIE